MKILMLRDYTYRIHSGNGTLHKGKAYETEGWQNGYYIVHVSDRDEPVKVPEHTASTVVATPYKEEPLTQHVREMKKDHKPEEGKIMEFKEGYKVAKKSGALFYNNKPIATVDRVEPVGDRSNDKVWIRETGSWLRAYELELVSMPYEPKVSTGIIKADLSLSAMYKPIIEGVSPDAPIIYNEKGGGQSDSPYRLDLVDPKAILDISKVLKEGADKYGENNWKKISIEDHLNHLLVHVYAHLAGDKSDKHLAHAACRAIFALGVELEEKK